MGEYRLFAGASSYSVGCVKHTWLKEGDTTSGLQCVSIGVSEPPEMRNQPESPRVYEWNFK